VNLIYGWRHVGYVHWWREGWWSKKRWGDGGRDLNHDIVWWLTFSEAAIFKSLAIVRVAAGFVQKIHWSVLQV
jgi:hypothetical protein